MKSKAEILRLEEYAHLQSVLSTIRPFLYKHPKCYYVEFDHAVAHDLTLFFVEPDIDFEKLKVNLGQIRMTLPAIKRVFSKPIISLKDTSDVVPVELVRKTNQETLFYLGNHANIVSKIENRHVTPRKLLTSIYEDDYGIYENLIFCRYIDEVLSYCRRNIRILKNLLYASETMEFNLLERLNHIDYFLALGKLHTGYIRDFNKYYDSARTLYSVFAYIMNVITARLKKPVYRLNKDNRKDLKLKKTNIFLMQKDYHKIYISYKKLLDEKNIEKNENTEIDYNQIQEDYFSFLKILSVFALSHFGFQIKPFVNIKIEKLDSNFRFLKWTINLKSIEKKALLITIKKDHEYKIMLYPTIETVFSKRRCHFNKVYNVDEFIFCTPFEERTKSGKAEFISMENIDSFRRLQQLFLRGMIYSDTTRDDCPFCGKPLIYDEKKKAYVCLDCRNEIYESKCIETNKSYFYTKITDFKFPKLTKDGTNGYDEWLYREKLESSMYFRNITNINEKGEIVCPLCNQIHHHN